MSEIPESENLSEKEVRKLRDNIYGKITDKSWDAVKAKWMEPMEVKWLLAQRENQPKLKK